MWLDWQTSGQYKMKNRWSWRSGIMTMLRRGKVDIDYPASVYTEMIVLKKLPDSS
jgi:hypothetical protein